MNFFVVSKRETGIRCKESGREIKRMWLGTCSSVLPGEQRRQAQALEFSLAVVDDVVEMAETRTERSDWPWTLDTATAGLLTGQINSSPAGSPPS